MLQLLDLFVWQNHKIFNLTTKSIRTRYTPIRTQVLSRLNVISRNKVQDSTQGSIPFWHIYNFVIRAEKLALSSFILYASKMLALRAFKGCSPTQNTILTLTENISGLLIMKFAFSIPSLLAHASAILLLGFSMPMVTPILASNNPDACKSFKPPHLNTVDDFIGMGHFQEECEKDSLAAVSSFTQAIKLNPKAEEPYYHRANAYSQLGNYKAAVTDYTEVIRQNTGKLGLSSVAYWNRARAYESLGEKQKAISDLTQVISESASSADAYYSRGNMHRDLGNKESAISDYKEVDKILQQSINGVFASGGMDSMYEEMLTKVRNELSQLGVSLSAPQLTTRRTLEAIAKMEVDRALNLARYTPQNPVIGKFDTQLQDLYKQLANSQPQPYKGVVENLISNAAYEKMEGLEKERSQFIQNVSPYHPSIILIDNQRKQLEGLIRRNQD